MGLWNVTSSKIDSVGRKTTISVTTEDEEVIKELIDGPKQATKDSKKTNSSKKSKATEKKPEVKKALSAPKIKKEASLTTATKAETPKYKPVKKTKLDLQKKPEVKLLPSPKKGKRLSLNKVKISGKGGIKHTSRNLNESQISSSNYNSMMGTRGNKLRKDYEEYRKKIEFSGLTNNQKNKLLDKLYKLFTPILNYDSKWYSPAVSGPARYPQAKMDKIYDMKMQATSRFLDWWKSIEPQLKASTKTKVDADAQKAEAIKMIKEGFNRFYDQLVNNDVPMYEKNGELHRIRYSTNAALAMHYVSKALNVDTKLHIELFEKLNKICNFNKNSNYYKGYKLALEGKITSESQQKHIAENNKVIFECPEYTVKNLQIQAGKRIAIKFLFYPKPQLVYALKKRGFTWYSYEDCFLCKPERFDLEWAKGIKKQYEKYL